MDKNTEDFYNRLRTELDNSNEWPAEYLFKFIVPSEINMTSVHTETTVSK